MNKNSHYRLNVHQAVDLLCQQGDLKHMGKDAVSARQGQQVHLRIQSSWPKEIKAEPSVKYRFERKLVSLTLGGRLDGIQTSESHVTLIEIKTLAHHPSKLPPAIQLRHRLQILLYAHLWWLLYPEDQHKSFTLKLIYFDIHAQAQSDTNEEYSSEQLNELTHPLIDSLLAWFEKLHKHRENRNLELSDLSFPYDDFRPGQRFFCAQVFRSVRDKKQMLIEAPTGSGKSLGTLFPSLKAMGQGMVDQIIITTGKIATQQAALDTVALMSLDHPQLRTLQLSAKDRLCLSDSICDQQDCPRQIGFFERLPQARESALKEGYLNSEKLRQIAIDHEVCPHGLQTYLQPWVDVLVGDYNYVFSPTVRQDWTFSLNKTALLIDEAHNLIDRSRDIFSAQLETRVFQQIYQSFTSSLPNLANSSKKLAGKLNRLSTNQPLSEALEKVNEPINQFISFAEQWLLQPQDLFSQTDPDIVELVELGQQSVRTWQSIAEQAEGDFTLLSDNILKSDNHSKTADKILRLQCLSPARLLKTTWSASSTSILFSATLTPPYFYQNLLGLKEELVKERIPSPFENHRLAVYTAPFINMRSKARINSISEVVRLIISVFESQFGNYWVFSPSFEYQSILIEQFEQQHPTIDIAVQPRSSHSVEEKEAFLNSFTKHTKKIGFVVLGGVFGESIDLPGDRLIGTILLGPGLPQMNATNQAISNYFNQNEMNGFDFAYQLPGWQKVVQAAGRVIRTESDLGVVILVDDRFQTSAYQALFPPHWNVRHTLDQKDLFKTLCQFWSEHDQARVNDSSGEPFQ